MQQQVSRDDRHDPAGGRAGDVGGVPTGRERRAKPPEARPAAPSEQTLVDDRPEPRSGSADGTSAASEPPSAAPSRYTARPGDAIPFLALSDACRHPRDGEAIQDPRTSLWWRYEGAPRAGVWRRMPTTWHPGDAARAP
jgi:hypothetical protein